MIGQKARLISPLYKKTTEGMCLNFYYQIYSKDDVDVGQLRVLTRSDNLISDEPIWYMTRNQGNSWRATSITLKERDDFQVISIQKSEFHKKKYFSSILIQLRLCLRPYQDQVTE